MDVNVEMISNGLLALQGTLESINLKKTLIHNQSEVRLISIIFCHVSISKLVVILPTHLLYSTLSCHGPMCRVIRLINLMKNDEIQSYLFTV